MHQKVYLEALVLYLLTWAAIGAHQPQKQLKSGRGSGSSVIFPVSGSVFPQGYYYVTMSFGNPSKKYFLDIDTGSDLTWLQCDAPCAQCTPAPNSLYEPKSNLVSCTHPVCTSLQGPDNPDCRDPNKQCDYKIDYADYGSSLGVLVKDSVSLNLTDGAVVAPQIVFGCGYNQEVIDLANRPFTDGVLGLGLGNSNILSQLRALGVTRNVVGHCFSGQGGGFLFFGDDFLPKSGITWKKISTHHLKHYSLGSADVRFGGQPTNVKGLEIVFDSGSTYTYFVSQAYNVIVSMIKENLNGKLKVAVEDKSLPMCWKGPKPFKSIRDAASYFKPLVLSFTNEKNVHFQMPPESYLIVTGKGNACLGILNGDEVGLDNMNLIGDISLQDKLVIYDNERQRIGWAPAKCNRPSNVVRDYGDDFSLPYPADNGFWKNITTKFWFAVGAMQ
ncbi:eukaryotic aspartyl protease family protein [Striga asiatica]|uniref:Aspartic proteinase Asp1 n=1 Tax=Striga asiatica TaxID=4170 RepID=A0A5A7PXZ5_STRAF|nr:eukaryotic aspartyl protease family protein [Striga asiatica]